MTDTTTTGRRTSRGTPRRSPRRSSGRNSRGRSSGRRSSRSPEPKPNIYKNENGSWDRAAIMRKAHAVAGEMHYPDRYHDRLGHALTSVWHAAKEWPDVSDLDASRLADGWRDSDLLQQEVEERAEERRRKKQAKERALEDGIEYIDDVEVLRENGWTGAEHKVNEYIPQHHYLQVGGELLELCTYDFYEHRKCEPQGASLRWTMSPNGCARSDKVQRIYMDTRHLRLIVRTGSYAHAKDVYEILQDIDIWELGGLLARHKKQQGTIRAMLQNRLGGEVELRGQVMV